MNFELESDMKAAKMKYRHPQIVDIIWTEGDGKIKHGKSVFDEDGKEFTLSDPATRDAVVQMLGEKYRILFFYTHPDITPQGWVAKNSITFWESDIYESRIECIRHAVMEVKDE